MTRGRGWGLKEQEKSELKEDASSLVGLLYAVSAESSSLNAQAGPTFRKILGSLVTSLVMLLTVCLVIIVERIEAAQYERAGVTCVFLVVFGWIAYSDLSAMKKHTESLIKRIDECDKSLDDVVRRAENVERAVSSGTTPA